MSDLVAFLRARLDEDEAAAKAWLPFGNPTDAQREHIASHDPARVLREVAAKRAIIDAHGWDEVGKFGSAEIRRCLTCLSDRESYEEMWEADLWPCRTLRHLAAVYDSHPDYDPAWKV